MLLRLQQKHLLALNPGDSGIYSILMTIYATAGRWDDAVRIKRSMQDSMTMWNFGCSSIQVEETFMDSLQGTSWTNPLILQFRANMDLKRDTMAFWWEWASILMVCSLDEGTGFSRSDGFGCLTKDFGSLMQSKVALTDDQIADNIIGVIFAACDTTASVLTWIVKYLGENASVLQAVMEEQMEIRKNREVDSLTWADTRRMPITSRVIQETMRVASILSSTFREAVQDVEYEGYLVPEGWKVLPLFGHIHHNKDNFAEPEKFDPNIFQIAPKPNTFLPFGNGTHSCPGNELTKLEMLVLLHHLTINYSWSVPDPESEVHFGPFALPLNGLPTKNSLQAT